MKKRTADRKAEMHPLDKDSYEKELDINISDKAWWKTIFSFSSEEYEDKTKWNYWRRKNVAINLQTLIEKENEYMKTLMTKQLKMFVV